MRELIDAGVLRAWVNRPTQSAAAWSISRQDVNTLLEIGKSKCERTTKNPEIDIQLGQILKTWRLRSGEFPSLLAALQADTLWSAWPTRRSKELRSLIVVPSEVKAWLKATRLKDVSPLSIDEAAAKLKIKQQVAYELVRRGLLTSVIDKTGSLRGNRITPSALEEFRSHYVPLTEVARCRCMGVRRALAEIPVRPACGPMVDGTRQYFYLRAEVMEVRLE